MCIALVCVTRLTESTQLKIFSVVAPLVRIVYTGQLFEWREIQTSGVKLLKYFNVLYLLLLVVQLCLLSVRIGWTSVVSPILTMVKHHSYCSMLQP